MPAFVPLETAPLRVVNIDDPRRCPHCGSNKWSWLKTIPTSPKTIGQSRLMRDECETCREEFFAVEKAHAEQVDGPVYKCVHCEGPHITKISKPNIDIDLYFCEQCRSYMGVEAYAS